MQTEEPFVRTAFIVGGGGVIPSVCMGLYREHNIGKASAPKSLQLDIRPRKTTGGGNWELVMIPREKIQNRVRIGS